MMPYRQDYRRHVDDLIQAALAAADPAAAVRRHLRRDGELLLIGDTGDIGHTAYQPGEGRVWLLSVGKAAVPMGVAAAEIIGDDLAQGVLIAKEGDRDWQAEVVRSPRLRLYTGGHPVPDEHSLRATAVATNLLAGATAFDLVLCLISGGASALFTQPLVPLADWQQLTQALLASGCTINELNCVRRQLDRVKGGGLARLVAPAVCASLILSDVVGNPLDVIGSGPTVLSAETPADALAVLARYQVAAQLETPVWQRIHQALATAPDRPVMQPHVQNLIVGDVRQAALAAAEAARQLGFSAQLLTAHLEGEAREVGRVVAAIARDTPPGHCLVLGGETTVTLRGDGHGGRNQETALAAAVALAHWPDAVVACFATDGEDGPTDAAGAVVTGKTVAAARTHNLDPIDYLNRNDSHTFFQRLSTVAVPDAGGHIQTGSTGTNVNDLILIFSYAGTD